MALFGSRRSYDTALSPQEETRFQQWQSRLPHNLQGTDDYDLRGAFLGAAREAGNGHLPDTWKKPNHFTFSNDSQYSSPQQPGGQWVEDGRGGSMFWASPTNLQYHSPLSLMRYFNEAEPDSGFILPINYSLPRG